MQLIGVCPCCFCCVHPLRRHTSSRVSPDSRVSSGDRGCGWCTGREDLGLPTAAAVVCAARRQRRRQHRKQGVSFGSAAWLTHCSVWLGLTKLTTTAPGGITCRATHLTCHCCFHTHAFPSPPFTTNRCCAAASQLQLRAGFAAGGTPPQIVPNPLQQIVPPIIKGIKATADGECAEGGWGWRV